MGKSNRRAFLKSSAAIALTGISAKLLPKKAVAFIAGASRKARRSFQTFACGYNPSKILTISPAGNASTPVLINTKDWMRINSWENKSHGITSDGSIFFWGQDIEGKGMIGNGQLTTTVYSSPILIGSGYKDMSGSDFGTLGIKKDGTLWGWGRNYYDLFPTNLGSDAISTPVLQSTGSWSSVSMNIAHTIAIRNDNVAFGWGVNSRFELGLGNSNFQSLPVQLPGTTWKEICIGYEHSLGIQTDGTLWAWGARNGGALGDGGVATGNTSIPVKIGTDTNWTSVKTGDYCTVLLKKVGTYNQVWATGDATDGITGTAANQSSPVQVGTLSDWTSISLCDSHVLALKSNGTLWGWGSNQFGRLGVNSGTTRFSSPTQIGSASSWTQISAGALHSLAIKDGELWSWGYGAYHALGNGTNSQKSTPVRVGTDSDWARVAAGRYISAGLKSDGTLWMWGYTVSFTNTSYTTTPVQVGTETDWSEVNAGDNMIVVRKAASNNIWVLGQNTNGQLGVDAEAKFSSPVQLGSETTWSKISVGQTAVAAIKDSGTLWHWGWYLYDVGTGFSKLRAKTPVQLGTATDWVQVVSYAGAMFGLRGNGTLWYWGLDQAMSGLATNGGAHFSTPVQVGTDSNWSAVEVSDSATFGLKTDGSLWSWGLSQGGELGTPSTTTRSSPVQIAGTFQKVSAGAFHVLAISSGSLYAWGETTDGQVGNGNTSVDISTPIKIGTASNWVQVFGGKYSTFAKRIP